MNLPNTKMTLNEYFISLKDSNIPVTWGDGNYIWIKHESFSAIRFPEMITSRPSEDEIKRVFKYLKCVLISFCTTDEKQFNPNAILYLSNYTDYDKKLLSKNVIRDINIAKNNLSLGFIEWDEILKDGFQAFHDTRSRVGLSDSNKSNFEKRFKSFSKISAHKALAAKFEGVIIAFMSLIFIDDFIIIQGSFSNNTHKHLCPNNGLSDFLQQNFLSKDNIKCISYGFSTIQKDSNKIGLHNYKTRIGFKAYDINRRFILHPLIIHLKKPISQLIRILLFIFPRNRQLKKAQGIF